MKLNDEQEAASIKIIDFIEGRLDLPFFTLTGQGGTGKTTMIKEVLARTTAYMFDRSAAAIAHAAKNVLQDSFNGTIPCYTVAQWLGLRMKYNEKGEIQFVKDKRAQVKLKDSTIAILDEASMIDDDLFNDIMRIVTAYKIKLIVLGDVYQLAPVKQNHDSKFFDIIHAKLTKSMRFAGPIVALSSIYRDEIKAINNGFIGDQFILNSSTSRKDVYDKGLNSGYYFKSDINVLIKQVAKEIIDNPENMNYSRVLAYKNSTIQLLNKHIRKAIYGGDIPQFVQDEILISKGGFTYSNNPLINNGQLLRVNKVIAINGPYNIPCYDIQFKDLQLQNISIPVVSDSKDAKNRYESIKSELISNAKLDYKQWATYYKFIDSFAYFDYAYSLSIYKSQGQTLENVYVMEGEVMDVKPLNLKQKFQALYVAVTRARKNVYIYNKNY